VWGQRVDGAVRAARRRRVPHHWRVFFVVAAPVAIASMDGGMVPILFHDIESSFPRTATTTLSWVFTAYTIGLAAFVVASGRIADRTGRRRMFLVGGATFVVGSALCGFAPSAGVLIAARFVEGTGHALFTPASLGLMLDAWPADRRTSAIGAWVGVGGISSGVGPTVGALFVEFGDWRWAFFLNVVIGVAVILRAQRVLDRNETRTDARLPDLLGIALLTVALGILSMVIVEGRTWGWTDPRILGSAAVCAVLATAFAFRSAHHPAPVLDIGLLRRPTYRISLVVSTLVSASMMANLVMQAQFLRQAWGYSPLRAGLAVTPLPVLAGVTAPFAGRLAGRFGHRNVILAGVGMSALALLAYGTLPDESPDYFVEFLPGMVLAGVGAWGLAISMINAAAVTDMSTENFGVGTAVLQTARQTGGILGVALFFGFIGSPAADEIAPAFTRLWLWFAISPALGFLLAMRLPAALGRASAGAAEPAPATVTAATRRGSP
jgi:EmrB/QacA subfamily drug resistance transporter